MPDLEHCLEMIRQSVMCQGATDIDIHIWDPESGELDQHSHKFKGLKSCRNTDKVIEWADKRKSKIYNHFP